MVEWHYIKGVKFFSKAIIIFVIAIFLLLGNSILAKKIEITEEDLKKIKTALDITETFSYISNLILSDDQLTTILNSFIKGGRAGTNITYGLLVLSALNEMELIDLVLSQRYKTKTREYFNQILNERLNLISYWKGIGFDIPRIVTGYISRPMAGLTLNTFAITNKTILILVSLNVLKKQKIYDGLWRYFDERRRGESHKEAWKLSKSQMGWAATSSFSFYRENRRKREISQLEYQFSTLYDRWGAYATPYGLRRDVKQQIKNELQDILVTAFKIGNFAEEKLSLKERIKLSWQTLRGKLEEIKTQIASFLSQDNPFKAGLIITRPEIKGFFETKSPNKVKLEIKSSPTIIQDEPENKPNLAELREDLDDILEEFDIVVQEISDLNSSNQARDIETIPALTSKPSFEFKPAPEFESRLISESKETPLSVPEPGPISTSTFFNIPRKTKIDFQQTEPGSEIIFCERSSAGPPARYRVLINEIAWMGTENSPNDEWIELKNVWGIPVKLAGWQLLDREREIKIIFSEEDIIPPGGFYLLERSDDDSLPTVLADKIYTGALNNNEEALYLFDENCRLEDEVIASPNWPAGDNSLKKPMQRFDLFYWYSAVKTPKEENGSPPAILNRSSRLSPEPLPLTYPKILITETYHRGLTNQKDDFVELYNPHQESLDLTGWYLQRKTTRAQEFSSYTPKNLLSGKIIPGQGYFLIANTSSSFANLAEVTTPYPLTKENLLVLKDPNQNIVDQISTGDPPAGKSYGRKWSTTTESYIDTDREEDFKIQNPTPKDRNQAEIQSADFEAEIEIEIEAEVGAEVDPEIEASVDEDVDLFVEVETGEKAGLGSENSPENGVEPEPESESEPEPEPESESEQPLLTVVINEIAWMGTKANPADEWIELYNNTTSTIDLTGWRLFSSDEGPRIIFSTSTIQGQSFYLIERSDDNTVSDLPADWAGSFTNSLNNQGEKLELRDAENNLIDLVDCSRGWFAGQAGPNYFSMERINPSLAGERENWASNNGLPWQGWQGKDAQGERINGTPKSKNSVSKNFTKISSGGFIIKTDFTFPLRGSPYFLEGSINVLAGGKLTIEPGVIIKFKNHSSSGSQLKVEGELEAIGQENKKIIFTSYYDNQFDNLAGENDQETPPLAGDWQGLYLKNSQTRLKNLIVRYAGRREGLPPFSPFFTRGAIQIEGGEVKIENFLIEKSQTLGLWLKNASQVLIEEGKFFDIEGQWKNPTAIYIENSDPLIKNSHFRNNKIGIWIEKEAWPQIEGNFFEENEVPIKTFSLASTFLNNFAQNNNLNGILVKGLSFSSEKREVDWSSADLPYILEGSTIIAPKRVLNIKPGVVIKFKKGSRIYVEGSLRAQGEEEKKIIFTSLSDDEHLGDTNNDGLDQQPLAGDWDFIHFAPSSLNSLLEKVIIKYGGWYKRPFRSGAVKVENGSLTILDSLFENNLFAGLELINSSTTIEKTIFHGQRAKYNYGLENSAGLRLKNSWPVLRETVFNDNYYGIYLEKGACPDLIKVSFGSGTQANSLDIFPVRCSPI